MKYPLPRLNAWMGTAEPVRYEWKNKPVSAKVFLIGSRYNNYRWVLVSDFHVGLEPG